jgi:hypothetical protein
MKGTVKMKIIIMMVYTDTRPASKRWWVEDLAYKNVYTESHTLQHLSAQAQLAGKQLGEEAEEGMGRRC